MTYRNALCLLLVPILVLSVALSSRQPVHAVSQTLSSPTQGFGLYDGCGVINSTCAGRLSVIAGGGFSVVLNYGSFEGHAQDVLNYAATAQKYDLKLIWAMNNAAYRDPLASNTLLTTYPALASTCGCSNNQGFIAYSVNLVKSNPATWGYYVGDEIPVSDYSPWSTFSQLVHQLDPTHPRLIIEGTKTNSYANNDLATFQAQAETIGQDYYPIGDSAQVPYTETGTLVNDVAAIATHYHKNLAMVLQAFSWQNYYPPARCSPYPACAIWPSKAQIESMLTATLSSRTQLVLYYSYFDMLKSSNFTQTYADLTSTICNVNQSCATGAPGGTPGGSPGGAPGKPAPSQNPASKPSSGGQGTGSQPNLPNSAPSTQTSAAKASNTMNLFAHLASFKLPAISIIVIGVAGFIALRLLWWRRHTVSLPSDTPSTPSIYYGSVITSDNIHDKSNHQTHDDT